MSKEQLYSVYVQFKAGEEAVAMGDDSTTKVEVIGDALVIERYCQHGKGKIIYNMDTVKSCSVVPLSDEDNKRCGKNLKERKHNER